MAEGPFEVEDQNDGVEEPGLPPEEPDVPIVVSDTDPVDPATVASDTDPVDPGDIASDSDPVDPAIITEEGPL